MKVFVIGAAGAVILWAIAVLLRDDDHCDESPNGRHEMIHESVDTDVARTWRLACLWCRFHTPGWQISWLRARVWPGVPR